MELSVFILPQEPLRTNLSSDFPLRIWKQISFPVFPRSSLYIPLTSSLFSWSQDDEIAFRHPPPSIPAPPLWTEPPLSLVFLTCSGLPSALGRGGSCHRTECDATDHLTHFVGIMTFQVPLLNLISCIQCSHCSRIISVETCSLFPRLCTHGFTCPHAEPYKILYFLISKGKSQDELCTSLPIVDLIWLLHSFWFDCPLWVKGAKGGGPMKSLSSLSGRWEGKGVRRFGSQGCGGLSHFKHSSSSVLVFAGCISVSDFIWIQGVTVLNVGNSSVGVSMTCHCGTAQLLSSSSLVSPQVWKASLRYFLSFHW